jgi:hypothetical protein
MAEDPLDSAWSEPNSDDGEVVLPAPERTRPSPAETSGALDPRHRRGSLGPQPIAAPLAEGASGAALHAHLAHLLDVSREALPPVDLADAAAEQEISPHEDLERQPDGVPHLVIGLTALLSVGLAALLIGVFHSGAALGTGVAVVIALVTIPLLVFRLHAKAERDRDHDHPSR